MLRPWIGAYVIHEPTLQVRRVSGKCGNVLHFSQVIKHEGKTFYWADVHECVLIKGHA